MNIVSLYIKNLRKEHIGYRPITFMADNFPSFLLEAGSVICSGNRLVVADAEICMLLLRSSNSSGKFIPTINRIVANQFPPSADWLATISYLQGVPHWNG
jgi:hypothetical protein